MKHLAKAALIIYVILLIPAAALAGWHTRIVNNTTNSITVHVYGEHLFWQQEDRTAIVAPDQAVDVEMPGGICPVYFTV